MTGLYINSNVGSLVAQNALNRNMNTLGEVLTRLSTGLRINSGKDDPAGLVASEYMKSDITATSQAIRNTKRANGMIAIADSALGQVSILLNDVRGLINEAANEGAMSLDQIAANQLQIDASLDSIDRISRTTTYLGKKLLDGSLDFQIAGLGTQVADITINSANFGTMDTMDVHIDITRAAETAKLFFNNTGISEEVILEVSGNLGSYSFPFAANTSVTEIAKSINSVSDATGVRAVVGADATAGQLVATSAGSQNDILFTALDAGFNAGDYSIKFSAGNSIDTKVQITPPSSTSSGVIDFQLQMEPWANPSVTNLREASNNIIGQSVQFGALPGNLLYFTSDKGITVKGVEFVHAQSSANPEQVATNLRSDGILEIEYRTGATAKDVARAVSLIDGLTASVATNQMDVRVTAAGTIPTNIASVRVDQITTGFPTQFKTWTSQFGAAGDQLVFTPNVATASNLGVERINYVKSGVANNTVVPLWDAATKTITLTYGSLATGADLAGSAGPPPTGLYAMNGFSTLNLSVTATNPGGPVNRVNGQIPSQVVGRQTVGFDGTLAPVDIITINYGSNGTTNPLTSLVTVDGGTGSATSYSWDTTTGIFTVSYDAGALPATHPTGTQIAAAIANTIPGVVSATIPILNGANTALVGRNAPTNTPATFFAPATKQVVQFGALATDTIAIDYGANGSNNPLRSLAFDNTGTAGSSPVFTWNATTGQLTVQYDPANRPTGSIIEAGIMGNVPGVQSAVAANNSVVGAGPWGPFSATNFPEYVFQIGPEANQTIRLVANNTAAGFPDVTNFVLNGSNPSGFLDASFDTVSGTMTVNYCAGTTAAQLVAAINTANIIGGGGYTKDFTAYTATPTVVASVDTGKGTLLTEHVSTKVSGVQTVQYGPSSGDILTLTPQTTTPAFTEVRFVQTAGVQINAVINAAGNILTITYDPALNLETGQQLADVINNLNTLVPPSGITATVSNPGAKVTQLAPAASPLTVGAGITNQLQGTSGTFYIATPGVNTVSSTQYGAAATDVMTLTAMSGVRLTSVGYVNNPSSATPVVSYNQYTGELTITGNMTAGSGIKGDVVAAAINSSGLGIKAAVANPVVAVRAAAQTTVTSLGSIGVVGNNGLDITARIAGTQFENTDIIYLVDGSVASDPQAVNGVAFEILQTAQKAGAVIMDGTNRIVLTAKDTGAAFNDVKISMAHDPYAEAGGVSVFYNSTSKELIIRGDFSGSASSVTYDQLSKAMIANTPFSLGVTDSNTGANVALGGRIGANFGTVVNVTTGQTAGTIGTDNPSLVIRLQTGTETANDVVRSLNDARNAQTAAYFQISNTSGSSGQGQLFQNGTGLARVFTGALTGGNNGYVSAVTANDLIEFIKNHEELSKIINADNYLTSTGTGKLTVFDEYLQYGSVIENNGLQFLGAEGSPDVRFVTAGVNSQLAVVFTPDVITYPQAVLGGRAANTSFTLTGLIAGEQLNDTVVRFVRLNNNYTNNDSSVTYDTGPSNAMAYCSINNNADTTGTVQESGKFVVYSTEKGDRYNDVQIIAMQNANQTESAIATYDENNKQLLVSIKDGSVTLSQAMDAINRTGLFTADFDYSFNRTPATMPPADTGPGIESFAALFAGANSTVIGSTGKTGGYAGGVITVYMGGNDTQITANAAMDMINSSADLKGKFVAAPFGNSTGEGILSFRYDNMTTQTDSCGVTIPVPRMVTSGGVVEHGVMEIQLATDRFGNSITTASDFVNFFNTLTAEQSRGISVSLMYPAGAFENEICSGTAWGSGLLQPTKLPPTICDPDGYYSLSFTSYGSQTGASNAYSDMISANGANSSYRVFSKIPGEEYAGINVEYVRLTSDLATPYAEYDSESKTISVYVASLTSAAEVQTAIETSASTKLLFSVVQAGTGQGVVTLRDQSYAVGSGTYEAGYRGGIHLQGAADADPNKLVFESIYEGSSEFVSVLARQGSFVLQDKHDNYVSQTYGQDIAAVLNGNAMTGTGRDLHLATAMLNLDLVTKEGMQAGDSIDFTLIGGGALFQLGADVVSTQQVRIGIKSVSTVTLGGPSGRLYMLRDGNIASLRNDTKLADKIIQEAITSVTMLRGRLGALQRCTLEPNAATLEDTLVGLSEAESLITDADFAEESSRLTRTQILVQSNSNVLKIANQLPQYAAMLLGG